MISLSFPIAELFRNLKQQVNNLQRRKVVAIQSRLFNDLLGLKGTSLARSLAR